MSIGGVILMKNNELDLTEKEYKVLQIIYISGGPVGSWMISTRISNSSEKVSSATIGRILRSLDERGYTEKISYQGRVLTKLGAEALKKYKLNKEKEVYMNKIIKLTKPEKKKELIDILIARRAIEGELIKLAVKNTGDEDEFVKELNEYIKLENEYNEIELSSEEDVKFHDCIAQKSNNELLQSALKLIRYEYDISPVLMYIRNNVGSRLVKDHKEIVETIKTGDPQKAKEAMESHINSLIDDVNNYWERISK